MSPQAAISTDWGEYQEFESECLRAVQWLAPAPTKVCSVRTPKLLCFDAESATQVHDYLPKTLDLKAYALNYFSRPAVSPSADPSDKANMVQLGRGLGQWLRDLHEWAAAPEQQWFRAKARINKEMQGIKFTYNYERLLGQLDKFPSTLKAAKTISAEVVAMAKAELEEEDKLQVIHGDFWTGKQGYLPPAPILVGVCAKHVQLS